MMIAQRDAVTPLVAASACALPLDTIICGDALDVLRRLPDASTDAIVTDPPYGLGAAPDMLDVLRAWLAGEAYLPRGRGGFMGKAWDAFVPGPEYWRECLRVLKPGGHALVFAGTRTWDMMGLALRLAGFELRDTLQWLYGSGFPKSLDVGKAMDKAAGASAPRANGTGWGTALKPAWEPIIVCRKPPSEPTIAANVRQHGVGALNITATRVQSEVSPKAWATPRGGIWHTNSDANAVMIDNSAGRWPPNLLLSHAAECVEGGPCSLWCPVRELDAQSGVRKSGAKALHHTRHANKGAHTWGSGMGGGVLLAKPEEYPSSEGGASRFFPTFRYEAKASRAERNRGCEGVKTTAVHRLGAGLGQGQHPDAPVIEQNIHPTVKPLALMSWLITLITPAGGIVLDPFAGSGSTLCAAKAGGWRYLGIEQAAEYVAIAQARLGAIT